MVSRSLSRRTLVMIATSMGAVTLLATAVTYLLTFAALEDRSLGQISQYTAERAKREEARFVSAEDNHRILHQVLIERLQQPITADLEANALRRFDELLERTTDGAVRSRRELGQGAQHTTTWIHKDTVLTPALRYRIVLLHDLCEQFFPAWRTRVQSLYISGPERFNTGFDPLFPQWVWEIDADWDQAQEEWASIATVENNPHRESKWTGVTIDPTTQVPIVTLSTPVDLAGKHVATLHHDISLEALVRENLRPDGTAMSHFIFRQDGLLIAHPDKLAELVQSGGKLMIPTGADRELASLYRAALAQPAPTAGYDPESGNYFAVSRLTGPGWFFATTMPRRVVRTDAFSTVQWVLWTGLASLAMVFLLHSVILRRELAQPLAQLTAAVESMRRGEAVQTGIKRDDELGELGRAFDQMAADVASRDAALRQANVELERRVEARTAELTTANEELALKREEALALLSRERELNELKSGFVSLVSHEVRTPLGVIQSSADILDRYADRLNAQERHHHLNTIFASIRNLAELVDRVLILGRIEAGGIQFKPVKLDLANVCAQIVDEVVSATGAVGRIQLVVEAGLPEAFVDPNLLRYVLGNLLSNASKYSAATSPIELTVRRDGSDAHFVVRDQGIGIPQGERDKLFESFARASNVGSRPGTGLGLMIVKRCVQAHHGSLRLESELGVGTVVTVNLPAFEVRSPSGGTQS
jgi:signal transduction histidine kinase